MRILYIDIDTLRPDHLGCYGYHRETSPNLDALAREGVIFSNAHCNSSPCVPARASLLSGRFGAAHGALTHWGPGSSFRFPGEGHLYDPDSPLLTRHLREHGYRTVTFSSFLDRHQAFWFASGWSEHHSHTLKQGGETAEDVHAALFPWLLQHGKADDWFLHVQYWDPHREYRAHPRWADRFASDPPPAWPDENAIAGHQSLAGPFTAAELFPMGSGISTVATMPDSIESVDDFVHLVNGYDGAIRYMDDEIGKLLELLSGMGILDEMLIIVSSDHGEAFGEHGVYADHVCASSAIHNIPLMVRWPGHVREGQQMDGFVYNVDLHPTLCDLLGLPTPPRWDGESFVEALRGRDWRGRSHLVWDHALYSCQRAVRTADWLFVRTYHPGLYPFDQVALYDMRTDPHETENVAASHEQVVADLEHRMQCWMARSLGRMPDPMAEVVESGPWRYVELDPWISRLRKKGRDDAADEILGRLAARGLS